MEPHRTSPESSAPSPSGPTPPSPSYAANFASEVADARLLLSFMLSERSMSAPPGQAVVSINEPVIAAINAAEDAARSEDTSAIVRSTFES